MKRMWTWMIMALCAAVLVTTGLDASAKRPKKKTLTMSWDIWTVDAAGQPANCNREDTEGNCTIQVQLVLREGMLRVFTWDLGRIETPTFMMETWGKCKGKLKKKGLICGASNFDCGDGCYADVNVGRFHKGQLIIERYESCRGGEECYDTPQTLYKVPFPNVKVKVP